MRLSNLDYHAGARSLCPIGEADGPVFERNHRVQNSSREGRHTLACKWSNRALGPQVARTRITTALVGHRPGMIPTGCNTCPVQPVRNQKRQRPGPRRRGRMCARSERRHARGWPDEESCALESPPTGGRGRDPGGRSGKAGITQFLLDERSCDPRLSEPASGTIEPADRPSLMLLHPPNLSAQRVSQCC